MLETNFFYVWYAFTADHHAEKKIPKGVFYVSNINVRAISTDFSHCLSDISL